MARPASFFLHDGDTVVFYGDSIAEQRLYTVYVQTAVHTQHPAWHIRFYDADVGGDRVSGGGAGLIDSRIDSRIDTRINTRINKRILTVKNLPPGDYNPRN